MTKSVLAAVGLLAFAFAPASAQQSNPWMQGPAAQTSPVTAQAAKPAGAGAPARIPLPVPRPAELASALAEPVAATHSIPVPAPASPAPIPVVATPRPAPVATPAAAPADTSPRAILERANASLNALSVLSAEFTQTGANGRRQTGNLFVQKPGKMRFEYDPPSPVEIVSDGSSVAIRDRKLNTQDLYSIGQTPLKFLLKDRVDLARDTKVLDVRAEPDLSSITLEDKSTFGGTSKVMLFFDSRTFALKQWIVIDPQGYETQVSLKNVNTSARLDPKLFDINYMRLLQ